MTGLTTLTSENNGQDDLVSGDNLCMHNSTEVKLQRNHQEKEYKAVEQVAEPIKVHMEP